MQLTQIEMSSGFFLAFQNRGKTATILEVFAVGKKFREIAQENAATKGFRFKLLYIIAFQRSGRVRD